MVVVSLVFSLTKTVPLTQNIIRYVCMTARKRSRSKNSSDQPKRGAKKLKTGLGTSTPLPRTATNTQHVDFGSPSSMSARTNKPPSKRDGGMKSGGASTGVVVLDSPVKSPNDQLEYRVIRLVNGLTALLISDLSDPKRLSSGEESADETSSSTEEDETDEDDDEDYEDDDDDDEEEDEDEDDGDEEKGKKKGRKGEKMAAAGLCIGVGSFSDPSDIPGLAHFLEHMVFMGSKKYPDENSFDVFVKRHGGSNNASTDCERTVFQFEIQTKHFYEGLDRFAQFFIAPLMKQDSMDREVEAVDSEFQMSIPSDTDRKQQLFGSHAKSGHPMSKFMWGNTQTLKTLPEENKIGVYEKLREFWGRYYSAQYMTLAVNSRESLDTLQAWVTKIFSGIPNNDLSSPTFTELVEPFDTDNFCKLYKVIPVKNTHQVELTWSLPSLVHEYEVKPLHYLSWVIGHEGKGSILSYLKKKVWALSLYCGNDGSGFEHNSTYSSFSITIGLTENGIDHLFEVITTVFQYIEMLRNLSPQERIYKEIQLIEANDFRWQEEVNAITYVETLCENMQLLPPKEYICGDQLMYRFDPKLIQECEDRLIPSKCNIVVMSRRFEKEGVCTNREKWYQTPYAQCDIDKDWLSAWHHLEPNPLLHLPEENKFIATNFDILEPDHALTEVPVKLLDNVQSRLWYKKDSKFNVPKAYMYFHLVSPLVNCSPQNAVLLDLFVNVILLNMREAVYPADVADLSFSLYGDETGLVIQVHGFNHKLAILFDTILEHVCTFTVDENMFQAIKNQLRKAYYNHFLKPSKLCGDVRLSILQQLHWTPVDKRTVLPTVTSDMLISFVKKFKAHLLVEGLVQGNITSQEALQMEALVRAKIACAEVPWNMLPEVRVMQLPMGEHFFRVCSFNLKDGNSVVTNYYQSGPATMRQHCLTELLIMLMDEPCFDILRTQEQLGYNVYCTCRNTFGILGFSVTVHTQADKFSCSHVDERIEGFLKTFAEKLEKLTEKEFKTQVTALIRLKCCVDLHLKEEVDRNWGEILSTNYVFDRLQKEVTFLSSITLGELRTWYQEHLRTNELSKVRKLGVQVVGCGKKTDEQCLKLNRKRRPSLRSCTHSASHLHGASTTTTGGDGSHVVTQEETAGQEVKATEEAEVEDEENFVYRLQFVSPQLSDRDESANSQNNNFILDVREFKQQLMIYPVTKVIA